MTAITLSFRPYLALAIAAALALPLAACKPSTPADTDTSAVPAPADSTTPAQPAEMPAADATGTAAPASLTEVTSAPTGTTSGMCSFDKVDGARFSGTTPSQVANAGAVKLAGWIGDDTNKSRPSQPALRLTGADGRAWEIALGAPVSRGDVAKHFESETMANSGFETTYDLSALPAGDYGLGVAYDRGSQRVLCEKGAHIHVGG